MDLIYLPQRAKELLSEQSYLVDNVGLSDSKVLLFEDKVLKIQPDGMEVWNEYTMMKWLEGKLQVPKCLYYGVENGISYLLMSRIPGTMSCDTKYMEKPQLLVRLLAEGLKKMWQVDISDCPGSISLNSKLAAAKCRVEQGKIDINDMDPETLGKGRFKKKQYLLEWLMENRPDEDPVLSHGDFCLPNIFLNGDTLTGYIDLGRMGVADRWLDIALCYRSLKYNFGGRYGGKIYKHFNPDSFFDALEMKPDWDKIRYYLLLDELF